MGRTRVTVTFRNPRNPERTWEGLCLVDTGATDCLITAEAVEVLGL
jgi:predicted aspartyl protease